MIQLTESLIAVEVPNVATEILLIRGNTSLVYFQPNYVRIDSSGMTGIIGVTPLSNEQRRDVANLQPNYVIVDLGCKAEYLVGVTPLDENQCDDIVEALTERSLSMTLLHGYKNYDSSKKHKSSYPFRQATKSFNSLLESKGLDINKKYVIIKIEK